MLALSIQSVLLATVVYILLFVGVLETMQLKKHELYNGDMKSGD